MIIRARAVVPMNGTPILNGAVAIAGERISEVGAFAELRRADDDVLDLGNCALFPGLINAHCHLDYTHLRGAIPRQPTFIDWVRAINARKTQLTADDYVASIDDGLDEALRFGTTTIVNFEAFPELIGRVAAQPMRVWWCGEMIDLRSPIDVRRVAEQCRASGLAGLAPHAPFTASPELYRQCNELGRDGELLLSTHLAESLDEMQMFRDSAGALFDFLQSLGRSLNDAGRGTPLEQVLPLLGDKWLVVHLNELSENDFALLQRAARFSIVHCPRSHAYFGHSGFAFAALKKLGYNICIGTDSLATTPDLSLLAELRGLRDVPAEDALRCITTNAASAIRQPLGELRAGYLADLIALPIGSERKIFEQLVEHRGEIPWVMIGGRIVRSMP